MSLDKIRKDIDRIDAELVPLLKERMECSLKVAQIKHAENLPVYHPKREAEILEKVENLGKPYGKYIRNIYGAIMTTSRSLQNDTIYENSKFAESIKALPTEKEYKRVVCQGAEGSFSHAAAIKMFGETSVDFMPNFEDVFIAISNDSTAVGILPVENSAAGSVGTVYDLILKYNHCIIKAVTLDVSQNLLTIGDSSKVKSVYSHPHALKQCERYIKEHDLECIECENTAIAAKLVAEKNDDTIAAIGSKEAAKLYGLTVAEANIQNETDNLTRFIAVSKEPYIAPKANTVSLALTVPHEKGSLYSILGRFADCGLNLTKIESRPAGQKFECRFYIDFDGNINDGGILNLLSALESELSYFVFLGNYIDN